MIALLVFALIAAICSGSQVSKPSHEKTILNCHTSFLKASYNISPFFSNSMQPTVDKLEVPKYLGLWYQIYGDLASLSTITLGGLCITALVLRA